MGQRVSWCGSVCTKQANAQQPPLETNKNPELIDEVHPQRGGAWRLKEPAGPWRSTMSKNTGPGAEPGRAGSLTGWGDVGKVAMGGLGSIREHAIAALDAEIGAGYGQSILHLHSSVAWDGVEFFVLCSETKRGSLCKKLSHGDIHVQSLSHEAA